MKKEGKFAFRPEALACLEKEVIGETLEIIPFSVRLCTLVAVTVIVMLILFGGLFHYTRKEHVSGYLVPDKGVIKVVAPQPGRVQAYLVQSGQKVVAGDKLVILSSERVSGNESRVESTTINLLIQRQKSLSLEISKQASAANTRRRELSRQLEQFVAEKNLLKEQAAIQLDQVANAERAVNRAKELVSEKYYSAHQLDQQISGLLSEKNRHREILRSIIAAEREIESISERIMALNSTTEIQALSLGRQIEEIEQQIADFEGRRDRIVQAPVSGTAASILLKIGETTAQNSVLLSIIPEGSELEAVLFIPARAIGFIKVGQDVSLRYHAFPYQKFGSFPATVVNIDRTVMSDSDASLPYPIKEPSYRVTVRPQQQSVNVYGERVSLQPGAQFDADISVERRRIADWLFDPIYSIAGKI